MAMDATKSFEGLSLSCTPGLLSLALGGRKNKRTELDVRRLTLCHAKVGGGKHCVLRCENVGRERIPPKSTPGLLSLTSGGRKNKRN